MTRNRESNTPEGDITSPPPTPNSVFMDPAASYWIRESLRKALDLDPVDAANDAEILAQVLRDRCDSILIEYGDQSGRLCIQCAHTINAEGHCGCVPLDDDRP